MTSELATIEAPVRPETRFCTMCQRHLLVSAFGSHSKHTCSECCRLKRSESKQTLIVDRAVSQLVNQITSETADLRNKKAWAGRVLGKIAQEEDLDDLVGEAIRTALINPKSPKARLDAVKAVERLQDALDEGRDELRDGLSKLSDDQKAQLGLALVMRAMNSEDSIQLLEEWAGELGYQLVKCDTLEGSATERQEASHGS